MKKYLSFLWIVSFFLFQNKIFSQETGDWTKETGIRVSNGVSPSTIILSNGTYRMYYTEGGEIVSATSTDGVVWEKETGVRISSGGIYDSVMAVNPCVILLPDGRYRIYYDGYDGTYRRILSATSTDGITFTKDEGVRIDTAADEIDNGIASVPEVIKLADGTYRMYYVYDWYGANSIRTATSTDSLTWTKEDPLNLEQNSVDPDVIILSDGTYRMFYTYTPEGESPRIVSAISSDGINWTKESGIRVAPGGTYDSAVVVDPDVVALANGSYRMYYAGSNTTEGDFDILSAIPNEEEETVSGWCFIATAAYGTPMAKEVISLKNFRDNVLLKTSIGRKFVFLYYTFSPPIANFIKDKPVLKTITRIWLKPFVWISYLTK